MPKIGGRYTLDASALLQRRSKSAVEDHYNLTLETAAKSIAHSVLLCRKSGMRGEDLIVTVCMASKVVGA